MQLGNRNAPVGSLNTEDVGQAVHAEQEHANQMLLNSAQSAGHTTALPSQEGKKVLLEWCQSAAASQTV